MGRVLEARTPATCPADRGQWLGGTAYRPDARGNASTLPFLAVAILALVLASCGGGPAAPPLASTNTTAGAGAATTPPGNAVELALGPASLATAQAGEIVERTKTLIRERASLRRSGSLAARSDFTVDGRALAPGSGPAGFPQPTPPPPSIPTVPPSIPTVGDGSGAGGMGEVAGGTATAASPLDGTLASGLPRSGSTIQEVGVEEDDLLKSDGRMLYGLQRAAWTNSRQEPDRLRAYQRREDGSVVPVSTLDLPVDSFTSTLMRGMVLIEDHARLALVGESNSWFPRTPDCIPDRPCILPAVGAPGVVPGAVYSAPKTTLQWVNVSGTTPVAGDRLVMDGQLIGIRQIGRYVYLSLSYTPYLAADLLPISAVDKELESRLEALRADDILPRVQKNGGSSQRLVEESDCFLQPANRSADLMISVILAFDAGSPSGAWQAKCFFGGTRALYMSPENLYLATSRDELAFAGGQAVLSSGSRTDIHKFRIRGGQVAYRGSGEVTGHLGWDRERAPYRMSEHAGDLRVVTFTGTSGWTSAADRASPTKSPSPATLSVLRENANFGKLEILATLPSSKRPEALGLPGEQIYAVRFEGEKAYLVTFRQVDPLYVLDLSNPADPKTAGELKLPGYSDYLFPLPNSLLMGVGKDASPQGLVGGVKVTLFDVRNASAPSELNSFTFGDRGSSSGLDYSSRGINLFLVPLSNPALSAPPPAASAAPAELVRVALPVSIRQSVISRFCDEQGLQLLEVDTRERTLKKHRWIASLPANCQSELYADRSVQIGQHVYYWTKGDLQARAW